MSNLNNEILSSVLKREIANHQIQGNIVRTWAKEDEINGQSRDINIHELKSLCEIWICNTAECGLGSDIGRYEDGSLTYSVSLYLTTVPCADEYFVAHNAYEAVFKACNWVLKEK